MLFRWVWSDPVDDFDEDAPPPLRERVRLRGEPITRTLWGVPVTVSKVHEAKRNGGNRNPSGERTRS